MSIDDQIECPCLHPRWSEVVTELRRAQSTRSSDVWILVLQRIQKILRLPGLDDVAGDVEATGARAKVQNPFDGLKIFLDRKIEQEENDRYLDIVLPHMVDRALEIGSLWPVDGLSISKPNIELECPLSRRLVASIVACAFFCLFPERKVDKDSEINNVNFSEFFLYLDNWEYQCSKLRCIFSYFFQLSHTPDGPGGDIVYIRRVLTKDDCLSPAEWELSQAPLCDVTVFHVGVVECTANENIQVVIGERLFGGSVLVNGRKKEELRFCLSPELIAGMLFIESLVDCEAVHTRGIGIYSDFTGTGSMFKFLGDHQPSNTSESLTCLIDRLGSGPVGEVGRQFKRRHVVRELNKILAAFRPSAAERKPLVFRRSQEVKALLQTPEDPPRQDVLDLARALVLDATSSGIGEAMSEPPSSSSLDSLQPPPIDLPTPLAPSSDKSPSYKMKPGGAMGSSSDSTFCGTPLRRGKLSLEQRTNPTGATDVIGGCSMESTSSSATDELPAIRPRRRSSGIQQSNSPSRRSSSIQVQSSIASDCGDYTLSGSRRRSSAQSATSDGSGRSSSSGGSAGNKSQSEISSEGDEGTYETFQSHAVRTDVIHEEMILGGGVVSEQDLIGRGSQQSLEGSGGGVEGGSKLGMVTNRQGFVTESDVSERFSESDVRTMGVGGNETFDGGVRDGVKDEINRGVKDGINRGARDGIDRGARDGIDRGARDGIDRGTKDGIDKGARDGLDKGVKDGKRRSRKSSGDSDSPDGSRELKSATNTRGTLGTISSPDVELGNQEGTSLGVGVVRELGTRGSAAGMAAVREIATLGGMAAVGGITAVGEAAGVAVAAIKSTYRNADAKQLCAGISNLFKKKSDVASDRSNNFPVDSRESAVKSEPPVQPSPVQPPVLPPPSELHTHEAVIPSSSHVIDESQALSLSNPTSNETIQVNSIRANDNIHPTSLSQSAASSSVSTNQNPSPIPPHHLTRVALDNIADNMLNMAVQGSRLELETRARSRARRIGRTESFDLLDTPDRDTPDQELLDAIAESVESALGRDHHYHHHHPSMNNLPLSGSESTDSSCYVIPQAEGGEMFPHAAVNNAHYLHKDSSGDSALPSNRSTLSRSPKSCSPRSYSPSSAAAVMAALQSNGQHSANALDDYRLNLSASDANIINNDIEMSFDKPHESLVSREQGAYKLEHKNQYTPVEYPVVPPVKPVKERTASGREINPVGAVVCSGDSGEEFKDSKLSKQNRVYHNYSDGIPKACSVMPTNIPGEHNWAENWSSSRARSEPSLAEHHNPAVNSFPPVVNNSRQSDTTLNRLGASNVTVDNSVSRSSSSVPPFISVDTVDAYVDVLTSAVLADARTSLHGVDSINRNVGLIPPPLVRSTEPSFTSDRRHDAHRDVLHGIVIDSSSVGESSNVGESDVDPTGSSDHASSTVGATGGAVANMTLWNAVNGRHMRRNPRPDSVEFYASAFTESVQVAADTELNYIISLAAKYSAQYLKKNCSPVERPSIGPAATEHSSVGVFANDPQLLAMLQWAAASLAGTTHLVYYTLNNAQLAEMEQIVAALRRNEYQVGHLLKIVLEWCAERLHKHDMTSLFSFIFYKLKGPI